MNIIEIGRSIVGVGAVLVLNPQPIEASSYTQTLTDQTQFVRPGQFLTSFEQAGQKVSLVICETPNGDIDSSQAYEDLRKAGSNKLGQIWDKPEEICKEYNKTTDTSPNAAIDTLNGSKTRAELNEALRKAGHPNPYGIDNREAQRAYNDAFKGIPAPKAEEPDNRVRALSRCWIRLEVIATGQWVQFYIEKGDVIPTEFGSGRRRIPLTGFSSNQGCPYP